MTGSRVSVCCDDGLWRQGRVTSMRTSPMETNKMFSVKMDANSSVSLVRGRVPVWCWQLQMAEWRESDIYGPGFMTSLPCRTKLVAGQAVFVTHNGREVEGSVVQHLTSQVGQWLISLVGTGVLLVEVHWNCKIRLLTQVWYNTRLSWVATVSSGAGRQSGGGHPTPHNLSSTCHTLHPLTDRTHVSSAPTVSVTTSPAPVKQVWVCGSQFGSYFLAGGEAVTEYCN